MPFERTAVVRWGNDRLRERSTPLSWIWEGVLAENAITLLSAPPKTGKTTLLSLLLDRRRQGGLLLDRPVRQGRTIVCSEEEDILWALRQPPLDFGPQLEFHQPIGPVPTKWRWRRFIEHLLGLDEGHFDLLVIDTVGHFMPSSKSHSLAMRRAFEELRLVADPFAGVLLLDQASGRLRSDARRPLAEFVDIVIDMRIPSGDPSARRRQFHGVSRYPLALGQITAELNPEGTDYVLLAGAEPPSPSGPALDRVRQLLSASPVPLTRQEILARWPPPEAPRHETLWRLLTHACDRGILVRTGEGNKAQAFRYELARPEPVNIPPVMAKAVMAGGESTVPATPELEKPKTLDAGTRLPFPYNIMKPEELPQEVHSSTTGT